MNDLDGLCDCGQDTFDRAQDLGVLTIHQRRNFKSA